MKFLKPEAPREPDATAQAPVVLPQNDTASQYVRALQEGDWQTAIDLTQWMQERLAYVAAQESAPSAMLEARQALVAELSKRTVSENQLRDEGVEDQYVFAPGSEVEPVRVDEGRNDLEEAVRQRVWFRVTYPQKTRALRDTAGVPLKSLVVGLNVSETGRVLKANIIGNTDIDWGTADYDWDDSLGE